MKKFLPKLLKDLWNDQTGQSTTEYILILSVVVMIAMKFKQEFQSRLTNIVGKLGTDIESATQQQ